MEINTKVKKAIIVDIDGTIADCRHRDHFITDRPQDMESFFKACKNDKIIPEVLNIINKLSIDYKIIFCTGRSSKYKSETLTWLEINFGDYYERLIMCGKDDNTPGAVLKEPIIDILKNEYDIEMAFDDDPNTIKMLQSKGIFAIQVPGIKRNIYNDL